MYPVFFHQCMWALQTPPWEIDTTIRHFGDIPFQKQATIETNANGGCGIQHPHNAIAKKQP